MNSQRGGNILAHRAVHGVNICAGLATAAKASGTAKVPGRTSKARGSRLLVASPPVQTQQGRGVLVMAVFVLAEVVVKSQSGQGWG